MELPNEMLDEILCRLPVKPLLRCKCVSKEWYSLIDSTAFIKKHLKTMIECDTCGVILKGFCGNFYLADFESLNGDVGHDSDVVRINDPLKTLLSGAEFFGTANGLVCMAKNEMNELLLLNPSTRKARKIPCAPPEFPRSFRTSEIGLCGFGYDHVNDDYKVVKIAECYLQFRGIMVIVYSLKTNSWTRIQNVPNNIEFLGDRGYFANGALHWLASKNPTDFSERIVSFDLALNQFKEVPFPPNGTLSRSLVPLGGSLCIVCKYPNRIDVWLLNKSGAENPWSKALSLNQPSPLGSFRCVRPVSFCKSHKDVLLEVDGKKFVWYDLERETVKRVRIRGIPDYFESYPYIESLLHLTEDKALQKVSQDKQEKKQQKKRDDFLSKGFKLRL